MTAAIHQEVTFNAPPAQIYDILTTSERFSQATGGAPTDISQEAGGLFSCFGGMIEGRQVELVPGKRIVQAWRAANWPAGVYSIVKFELAEQDGGTLLVFDHAGYPEGQGEHLASGWHANYWVPIEKLFA
ncbi:SRPBCC family protein [Paenibacillus silvisoli]|uniref:SRPBCC family protein n=1 Tax=Paenibacillus silvisoli TaxID=3110539 RepID=UPI002804D777|nr:SRPBCC family protein [Paenibacillus silvisoli]